MEKTKLVATKIRELLNCEIEEVVDLKNRKGILGWIISGYDAINKKFTTIKSFTKNLEFYDNIILCSPVWVSSIPPAIRTFLNNFKDKIKNISFVATMTKTGAEKMFEELELLVNKTPKFTFAINSKDLKTENYLEKLKELLKNL